MEGEAALNGKRKVCECLDLERGQSCVWPPACALHPEKRVEWQQQCRFDIYHEKKVGGSWRGVLSAHKATRSTKSSKAWKSSVTHSRTQNSRFLPILSPSGSLWALALSQLPCCRRWKFFEAFIFQSLAVLSCLISWLHHTRAHRALDTLKIENLKKEFPMPSLGTQHCGVSKGL